MLLATSVAAGIKLLRSRGFVWWDAAIFTAPFVIYIFVALTGARPKSLSNLIEPIVLAAVVMVAFSIRAFAFRNRSHETRSMGALILCCATALVLYALVPLLPE